MTRCARQFTNAARWAAAGLFLLVAGAARAQDYSAAQTALFDTPHLENVAEPTTLRYAYSHGGSFDAAFRDRVDVIVTEVDADGRKNVSFDYLSDKHRQEFPAVEGFRGNPLIMIFLQYDVDRMGERTGGSSHYFRNRIRESFFERATTEATTIEFGGRQIAATLVKVQPFLQDPNRVRFEAYAEKSYEFLLAPEVPGGIYRLRTVTPGASAGQPLEENILEFESAAP
jgi:hypothetical protein